jgi:hypothetical protein
MTRTYSLQQVADTYLPPEWKRPVLWLQRRLKSGDITGYKLSRSAPWRMTQADVDAMVARYRNSAPAATPVEVGGRRTLSFTRTTTRRLGTAS